MADRGFCAAHGAYDPRLAECPYCQSAAEPGAARPTAAPHQAEPWPQPAANLPNDEEATVARPRPGDLRSGWSVPAVPPGGPPNPPPAAPPPADEDATVARPWQGPSSLVGQTPPEEEAETLEGANRRLGRGAPPALNPEPATPTPARPTMAATPPPPVYTAPEPAWNPPPPQSQPAKAPAHAAVAADQAPAMELLGWLVVKNGPRRGAIYPIGDGTRIGRGRDNTIQLDDPQVSRAHGWLRIAQGAFEISDLNSGNGTFVNDVRISAPTRLAENDVLRIGQTALVLKTLAD